MLSSKVLGFSLIERGKHATIAMIFTIVLQESKAILRLKVVLISYSFYKTFSETTETIVKCHSLKFMAIPVSGEEEQFIALGPVSIPKVAGMTWKAICWLPPMVLE